MLECRNISARLGSFSLRNVSFEIPAGRHAVLTGPTASGKTTLLEVIAGAVSPASGNVIVGGIDVTSALPETRNVGLVPQHGYLFLHLSVRQNVEYGAAGTGLADDLARRFGIEQLMDRSVTSLSGGERQLVALCRALVPRPAVLLLDEPFSALDAKRRDAALQEFATLQVEWSFTVLHVTHQEGDAILATERLAMADGNLTIY